MPDGQELNPLLQDLGLAVHPPFLYLGYVGFSMAFSFSVAALIEGKVDASWARWVRPWVLAAWCFLTIGITLGSFWAYYELGWGGWWFWDPVENASFMPWLAGTALLHSALVVERRQTLVNWTILLGILTFSLSLTEHQQPPHDAVGEQSLAPFHRQPPDQREGRDRDAGMLGGRQQAVPAVHHMDATRPGGTRPRCTPRNVAPSYGRCV